MARLVAVLAVLWGAGLCVGSTISTANLPRLRGGVGPARVYQGLRLRGGDSESKPKDGNATGKKEAMGAKESKSVEELVAFGRVAMVEQNYSIAADFLSQAVEIRVAEEGELGAGLGLPLLPKQTSSLQHQIPPEASGMHEIHFVPPNPAVSAQVR